MNKSQLVSTIATNAEISTTEAEKTLSATLETIITTLKQGNSVAIVGFGNFGVKKRSARKVRNPRTGEEMMVKETIVPFFKAGKNLKETVDSNSKQ